MNNNPPIGGPEKKVITWITIAILAWAAAIPLIWITKSVFF